MMFIFLLTFITFLFNASCLRVDKDHLEEVIIDNSVSENVVKLLHLSVSQANDNMTFGVESTRVSMTLQLENYRKVNRTIIINSLPLHFKEISVTGMFQTEIQMYRDVFPKMEDIMLEYADKSEKLWPKMYDFKVFSQFTIEDIMVEGDYKKGNLANGFDLKHCQLAMTSLAKFHALSAVMNERGTLPVAQFNASLMQKNKALIRNYYELMLKSFAIAIRIKWGPGWEELAAKIESKALNVTEELLSLQKRNPDGFNVLNHGTFDNSALYFKYRITDVVESESPIALKCTSFQASFYNSPAFDIQNFLSTSPEINVMMKHKNKLIGSYYKALTKYLSRFGYTQPPPSLAAILKEIKRTEFFALVNSINQLSYNYLDPSELVDLEKLVKESWNSDQVKIDTAGMFGELYTTNMKLIARRALEEKVL